MLQRDRFQDALTVLDRAAPYAKISERTLWLMRHPATIIVKEIPVTFADGSFHSFQAWRVQYRNPYGTDQVPYKGGIRYHPAVTLDEVLALAFRMTLKCLLMNLEFGGAKGALVCDPKAHTRYELEAITRILTKGLRRFIGPHFDVPAPDVGTDEQIMAWIADEYGDRAVVTGKPVPLGGIVGRNTATARGGQLALEAYLVEHRRKLHLPKNPRIAVEGFGNAGMHFATFAARTDSIIVAVSDSSGGIVNQDGIDLAELIAHKHATGSVKGLARTKTVSHEEFFNLPCDILVPAALEGSITAPRAKTLSCKMVLELANGPTTPEADTVLEERGIAVLPDILANGGGVTVSKFEHEQNIQGGKWTAEEVDAKLTRYMHDATEAWMKQRAEGPHEARLAAYVIALRRYEECEQYR